MIVQCQRCHLRHDLTGRPPGTTVSCRCGAPLRLSPSGGETRALTCPQCGGQADENLARCQHCQSALATIRCATCFGLAFQGNHHCPQCGDSLASPAVVTHESGREPLPCPSCRADLDAMVVDNTLIDACGGCGGVWIDHFAFEKLVAKRRFADLTSAMNLPAWQSQESNFKPEPKDALYVRCPVCEHFMHRRNYARRSGIILDVCAAHGIWFDANELSRVFNYSLADGQPATMRPQTNIGASETTTHKTTSVILQRSETSRGVTWVDGVAAISSLLVDLFS